MLNKQQKLERLNSVKSTLMGMHHYWDRRDKMDPTPEFKQLAEMVSASVRELDDLISETQSEPEKETLAAKSTKPLFGKS